MTEHKPMEVVLMLIMAVVVILLLSYLAFNTFKTAAESSVWKSGCIESIKAHALFSLSDFAQRPQIKCPMLELNINNDLSTKEGQDQAKGKIADAMKVCYGDLYNRGRYKLFEKETIYCHPCSIIRFEDKGKVLEGFAETLNKDVPYLGVSYLEYFSLHKTSDFERMVDDTNLKLDMDSAKRSDYFDTNKAYGIIFVYVRGLEEIEEYAAAIGTTPTVLSFVAGTATAGVLASGVIIFLGSNPIGWATTGVLVVGYGVVRAIKTFFRAKPEAWLATVNIVEWNEKTLLNLKCQELPVSISEK